LYFGGNQRFGLPEIVEQAYVWSRRGEQTSPLMSSQLSCDWYSQLTPNLTFYDGPKDHTQTDHGEEEKYHTVDVFSIKTMADQLRGSF
jgi:hypothetical protein